MSHDRTIGLALGGGGARGMAHILVCEAFDELGLKPDVIAGTSIGAIIGVGYASGLSGQEMRERAVSFFSRRREVLSKLWRARPLAFSDLLRGRLMTAQFDPLLILETFTPGFTELPETFEELAIPLKVVSSDFYGWTETVVESGPLRPAIAASIAIPSLFRPVVVNGRMQIDGGCYNPLPFDVISDAGLVIACDVAGGPQGEPDRCPGLLETIVGAAQLSMQAIVTEKLKWLQPDILVRPEINGVFVLDFLKSEAILDMNAAFKDDFKRRLDQAVNNPFEEQPAEAESAGEPLPLAV